MHNNTQPNAPFIREIIDKTQAIGGDKIQGSTPAETRDCLLKILDKQLVKQKQDNARTKTY